MKNTTITATTPSSPHVKWGHLIGAIAITLVALALIGLNLSNTIFGVVALDIFIAYGPLVSLFLLWIAVLMLVEDFLPSFKSYKAYRTKENYKAAVKAAVKKSRLMTYFIQEDRYQKFLKQNPKYRI